jgi:hypothetical protein
MRRTAATNPLYWLPFPVDKWLGEIAGGLRPEQKGALIDLLSTAWQQQPPCTLPNDDVYLAGRSGLGSSWKRLSPAIMAHFRVIEGGRLECAWLRAIYDEQLVKYQNRSEANKRNRGKRGRRSDDASGELFGSTVGSTNGATNGATNRTADGDQVRDTVRAQNLELEGDVPPLQGVQIPPPDGALGAETPRASGAGAAAQFGQVFAAMAEVDPALRIKYHQRERQRIPVTVDPSLPPDEVRLLNEETGQVVRMTGLTS